MVGRQDLWLKKKYMHSIKKMEAPKVAPTPEDINELLRDYPRLDRLMAETLLWYYSSDRPSENKLE